MSVANVIQSIKLNVQNAYNAVETMGGELPQNRNIDNLNEAILSIPAGGSDIATLTYLDGEETKTLHITDPMELTKFSEENDSYGMGSGSTSSTVTIDGTTINKASITKFEGGKDLTIIPKNFMGNFGYSSPVTYDGLEEVDLSKSTKLKEIMDSAFYQAKFTTLDMGNSVETLGDGVFYGLAEYNKPLTLPTSLKTIGSTFIYYWKKFNQPVVFPEGLKTLGGQCVAQMSQFNSPVTISSTVETIPSGFLSWCSNFNSPVTFAENSQLDYMCGLCSGGNSFNQPVSIPAKFFKGNIGGSNFNSPVTFTNPDGCSIGSGFMSNCSVFNQPLSNIKFANYIHPYDKAHGNYTSMALTDYDAEFLNYCTSFNQPLDMEELTSDLKATPKSFLMQCTSFNQDITIPADVETIAGGFMAQCNAFESTLTVNSTVAPSTANGTNYGYNYTLVTNSSISPIYAKGIKIEGAGADIWVETLPNSTTSNQARKWRRAGAYAGYGIENGDWFVMDTLAQFKTICYSPLEISAGYTKIDDTDHTSNPTKNQITDVVEVQLSKTLTEIPDSFCNQLTNLTTLQEIPASVTTIGKGFMQDCQNYTGTLDIKTNAVPAPDSAAFTFGMANKTCTAITEGVHITGANAGAWITAFPNVPASDSSSGYARNIVLVD